MNNKFRKFNIIFGWLAFLIAFISYILTLEPTASLWDCGEFIACNYKLQIGHPPGAPMFMLLGRIISLFAPSPDKVAYTINLLSALASALTVLFLFWTITHFVKKFIPKIENEYSTSDIIIIIGSGLVGSLAFAYCDSFWFSAVEGEVYALSSLFTALVFWAILKWEDVADEKYANRWLVFIAYIIGLSIGIHLLNLLAIPAIVLIYYFKKFKPSLKGLITSIFISFIILGILLYIIIQGTFNLASKFELFFVNSLGLPYYSGIFAYLVFLIVLLAYGLIKTYKNNKVITHTILLCLTAILIGYSSYATIIIRSLANPSIDENNPENIFNFLNYINREQYGDRPLFYGQYFNAPVVDLKVKKVVYTPKDGKYIKTDEKIEPVYDKKYCTIFPRMYSSQPDHIRVYMQWGGIKEHEIFRPARDEQGNVIRKEDGTIKYDYSSPKRAPSFAQNLRFFFTYQLGHMYFRYFMWNFSGRQNDKQGYGESTNGNWITGIGFLDKILIGASNKDMPPEIANDPSRNVYYMLPFIFGLIGLFFQINRDNKNFWVVLLLFFMTGIAIIIYLNQTPNQPRERDYSYAGSLYAYSIWIGIAVYAIYDAFKKFKNKIIISTLIVLISLLAVPYIMAKENWDDHNRSGRYTTRDIAHNYLNSCAPNAILFTNGDNDTFPLWYAQEVEKIRTDVRVVNLMLLNMDWYIDQMRRKVYESDPLPITIPQDKYLMGTNDIIYILKTQNEHTDLKEMVNQILSEDPSTYRMTTTGKKIKILNTNLFKLDVNIQEVLSNGTVKKSDSALVLPTIEWNYRRNNIGKSEMIVMDILANNNWKRPIYYASIGHEGTLGLEDYLQLEGFAYRLVPIKTPMVNNLYAGRINTDILYENLMNKFKWGRMNEKDVYLDYFHKITLNSVRMRHVFTRLANQLYSEGKKDSAIKVLDKVVELTPPDKIPYDFFTLGIIEAYARMGENIKSQKLIKEYSESCDRLLKYYLSQTRKFIIGADYDIRYNFNILNELKNISSTYKYKEFEEDINKKLQEHYNKYVKYLY